MSHSIDCGTSSGHKNFSSFSATGGYGGNKFTSGHGKQGFASRSFHNFGSSGKNISVGCSHPVTHGLSGYDVGSSAGATGCGSMANFQSRGITPVTVNQGLLAPLSLDIDPNIQSLRRDEKEQMKDLNNKFASFIDKVRFLEQQKKVLETKLAVLQDQNTDSYPIEPLYEAFISHLRKKLSNQECENQYLNSERRNIEEIAEALKHKYEQEASARTNAENEFAELKRDLDKGFMDKIELEAKLDALTEEINFLRVLFDAEISQLRFQISDISVMVSMDNSRDLDLGSILAEVRAQYEDIANRSRAEAQDMFQSRFEELQVTAGRTGNYLQGVKGEICELQRTIQQLKEAIGSVKAQHALLEAAITEAEEQGESVVRDAKSKLSELEAALQKAKQDMARQLREYQELLNVKLALDIEIATYRKLLEVEESRIREGCGSAKVAVIHSNTGGGHCGVGNGHQPRRHSHVSIGEHSSGHKNNC